MRLYLLRHGIAEDSAAGRPDAERRLTDDGVAVITAEARAMKKLDLKLDAILSSPYPRALQTAELVADALSVRDRLAADERLAPGFGIGALQEVVAERPRVDRLMIVGHNPDLPVLAARLVGAQNLELGKGGLMRVDIDRIEPGRGTLRWLIPAGVLS